MSSIPNPPFSLGLHKLSHFTQAILFSSEPHPQRKFLCSFMIVLHTQIGAVMTYFMRQICPTNDKNLPFQLDNLFLILLKIGC